MYGLSLLFKIIDTNFVNRIKINRFKGGKTLPTQKFDHISFP